jgi:glucose-6-phosphate isomerase
MEWFFNRLFKEYNQPRNLLTCGIGKWSRFKKAISDYFDGEIINQTENRAVLHTALQNKVINVNGQNVVPEIWCDDKSFEWNKQRTNRDILETFTDI